MAPQTVELFVTAQLNPEFDFVAFVVGTQPTHHYLVGRHAQRGCDFTRYRVAHLAQPLRWTEVVDEDHRRAMVASPPVPARGAAPRQAGNPQGPQAASRKPLRDDLAPE